MDTDRDLDDFVRLLDYPMFVVTAVHEQTGERSGCLVGFATQCSIDPARLLVCLSRTNHTYRVAARAPLLAVHGLGSQDGDLAELFGTRTGDEIDKFARCAWYPGPRGVPLLRRCGYRVVGAVLDRFDLGDHDGFLLRPVEVSAGGQGQRPLMFSAVRDLSAGHPA